MIACESCGGEGIEWVSKVSYGELAPFECVECRGTGLVKS